MNLIEGLAVAAKAVAKSFAPLLLRLRPTL